MAPGVPIKPPGPYDTKLSPADEQAFAAWKAKNAPNDSGEDYDLRGFFKSGLGTDARGHATDQFKKPNHPTFSTFSQYHGADGNLGGQWINQGGQGYFVPSATNLKNQSFADLQGYFKKYEPDTILSRTAPVEQIRGTEAFNGQLPAMPLPPIPAALSNRLAVPAMVDPGPINRIQGQPR